MSCQRSFWFRVPLTKQLKRDNAGHGEATIHNAATVDTLNLLACYSPIYGIFLQPKMRCPANE